MSIQGAGLENLGNTCFLNAILQCFTHTVPLVQALRSCNHSTPCDGSSKGFCVICTLRDHIELALASSGAIISPLKLVENLTNLSSSFRSYQQEDAHEFLQVLLDKLDTSFTEESSFVKQIFGGRLISQVRCCNCDHYSNTIEPLLDLSLEVKDVDSLVGALKSFTMVEIIDSETMFTCESCKQVVSVEKQLMLDQAPSVAAFHLKRFKYDGTKVEKINKHVEYPLELDLEPYTCNNQNNNMNLNYELYAVVVHSGVSPYSGHYISFIRSSPNTWHRFDDSKVLSIKEEYVLSQNAYILFYAKQGSPWFSSLLERQKINMAANNVTSPIIFLDDMEGICDTVAHKGRHHVDRIPTPWALGACNTHDKVNVSRNDTERVTVVPIEASNCSQEVFELEDDFGICPYTPPKAPSLDLYSNKEFPGTSIPCHLGMKHGVPYRRPSGSEDMEEMKKKEACGLVRSMPISWGMNEILGSHSHGSWKRKKRRSMVKWDNKGPNEKSSIRNACGKLSPCSLMCAMISKDLC